jgi:hypothetical protein
MAQLSPVIMNGLADVAWAPMNVAERWIILSGAVTDDDIARAVASIASYSSKIGVRDTIEETTAAMVKAKGFVVGGGLMFRDDDFCVEPSCCCGLEGWREWAAVKKGGQSPWMGHDPMPWIDCTGDAAIVWTDDQKSAQSVTVSYQAIQDALNVAARDLADFAERLRSWGASTGAHKDVAETFVRVFEV